MARAAASRPTPSCSRPAAPASSTRTRPTRPSRPATAIAAALRAGAAVADLEFFQFHPTVARGAGQPVPRLGGRARRGRALIDENGRRFAFDAHPDGELAPRDVVARGDRPPDGAPGRPPGLPRRDDLRPTSTRRGLPRRALPRRSTRAVRDRGLDWARSRSRSRPPRTTDGRRHDRSRRAARRSRASTRSARSRAPACTARTASRRTRCWRAPCSARARATRSPTDAASGMLARRNPNVAEIRRPPRKARVTRPSFTRDALQELLWEDAGTRARCERARHAASVIAAWRAPAIRSPRPSSRTRTCSLVGEERRATAALRREESRRRALPHGRPRRRGPSCEDLARAELESVLASREQ